MALLSGAALFAPNSCSCSSWRGLWVGHSLVPVIPSSSSTLRLIWAFCQQRVRGFVAASSAVLLRAEACLNNLLSGARVTA
jgi:hypothetical protein